MEEWIRRLINAAPSPLRGLAQAIADPILFVWETFTSFGMRIRSGWTRLYSAILAFTSGLLSLADEAYATLWWLVRVLIPTVIGIGVEAALREAARLITVAENRLGSIVDSAVRWLVSGLNNAIGLISQLRDWALARLASIVDTLNEVACRVRQLLSSPAHLATWLAGAMWSALWSYFQENAERFAAVMWRQRRAIAIRSLGWIEDILARLL